MKNQEKDKKTRKIRLDVMDITNNIWFAGRHEESFRNLYEGEFLVKMAGDKDVVELEISIHPDQDNLEEDDNEDFFGLYRFETKTIHFVWPLLIQVRMCSPSAFADEIDKGEAKFVKLTVNEKPNII